MTQTEKYPAARPLRLRGLVFFAAGLGVALLVHLSLLSVNLHDLADDAMISARYARSLAEGHGLRYNGENIPRVPGLDKPVEGYSNFLWVLGLAAGLRLQYHPRIITAVMGMGSSLLSVLALGWWVRKRTGSGWRGVMASLILASTLSSALWAVQGLETPLFALLGLLAMATNDPDRPRPAPYLFAFLACLTRPDGLLVPVALIASHSLSARRDFRLLAKVAIPCFALPFGVYTIWRYLYFGSLLPNVFFAKTGLGLGGVRFGLSYLLRASWDLWPIAILLVLSLVVLVFSPPLRERRATLLAPFILVFAYLIFIVAVGGDFMPDYRFVTHVLPVVIGTAAIGMAEWESARGQRLLFALLALLAAIWNCYAIGNYQRAPSFAKDWHRNQADWYGRTAAYLTRNAQPGDLIAAGDIGYLGYVSAAAILDTNGLVDPYLARRPGAAGLDTDLNYVLEKKPDYLVVMVHYFEGGAVLGHAAFDRAALADPRLNQEYALAVEVPGWRSLERSFSDQKLHLSLVRFRIYRRKIT